MPKAIGERDEARGHLRRASVHFPGVVEGPTSAVTRSCDMVYVSGLSPFDPDIDEVVEAPGYYPTSNEQWLCAVANAIADGL